MSLTDLAFLIGPLGALIIVPLAVSVMLTSSFQRDWTAGFLLSVCPILGAAWLGYWALWATLLQHMNAYNPAPPGVELAADVCLVVCALAVTLLAAGTFIAMDDSRHQRSTETETELSA